MFLKILKTQILLVAFILVVACERKSSESKFQPNYKSGECSSVVGLDYKFVFIKCYYIFDPKPNDYRECKKSAVEFLERYPGINCVLPAQGPFKDLNKEMHIKEENLLRIIDELVRMGY